MSGTPTLRIGQFYLFPGGRRQGCFGAAVLYTSSAQENFRPACFLLSVGSPSAMSRCGNSRRRHRSPRRAYILKADAMADIRARFAGSGRGRRHAGAHRIRRNRGPRRHTLRRRQLPHTEQESAETMLADSCSVWATVRRRSVCRRGPRFLECDGPQRGGGRGQNGNRARMSAIASAFRIIRAPGDRCRRRGIPQRDMADGLPHAQ